MEEYLDIVDKLPRENQLLDDSDPKKFIAKMGADALEMLLGGENIIENETILDEKLISYIYHLSFKI